jgi:hypothetical protein
MWYAQILLSISCANFF